MNLNPHEEKNLVSRGTGGLTTFHPFSPSAQTLIKSEDRYLSPLPTSCNRHRQEHSKWEHSKWEHSKSEHSS